MIAYSDNTATDLATRTVGADRVRALIAQLGLSAIRIPDSTRIFFSYLPERCQMIDGPRRIADELGLTQSRRDAGTPWNSILV